MPSDSNSQSDVLRTLLATKVDKLYGLRDIGPSRAWDYSLPTISSRRRFTDRSNFGSDASFFDAFGSGVNGGLPYRILEDAGAFETDNDLVLFGGCILDIILKRANSIKDFDLRLIGEDYVGDEAKCVARAKEFVSRIFAFFAKENKKVDEEREAAKRTGQHYYGQKCNVHEITISRSRSTVTVHVPPFGNHAECVFQLTFAPAKSAQEMLAACQPHCTRLAIKDRAVVMDHLARYCIESTCMVLDTTSFVDFYCVDAEDEAEQTRRLASGRTIAFQLSRYIKYHEEKGFDIILPDFDMGKAPRRNLAYRIPEVLALPSLTVIYDDIDRNQILARRLELPRELADKVPRGGLVGGYDARPAPHVGVAVHHNVRCLVHDVYDSFRFVARGERWDHVFDFAPSLTPRMVRKSYETVVADIVRGERGAVPISKLVGYFSVTPPDAVVEELIAKPLRDAICVKGRIPKPYEIDRDDTKRLAEMEISSVIEKIGTLRETLKGKGLDKLVVPYATNVSTIDEVFNALYGAAGLNRGLKRKAED